MGVTNSWIAEYQTKPAPCISQSMNASIVPGFGPINNCWMWLLIGAVAVALLNGKKS